jgi:hypothetical protein
MKHKIEAEYECGCWFDYDSSEQVTQSCIYHNKRLLMRSDVKKDFADKYKSTDLKLVRSK